ncbi:hypothetical protein J6590_001421 [Homalodisca vitripennis]|nr:hypothetical protein J6590_001421 [Homalodisca vitripennis]
MLTGHGPLSKHLLRVGLSQTDEFRPSGEEGGISRANLHCGVKAPPKPALMARRISNHYFPGIGSRPKHDLTSEMLDDLGLDLKLGKYRSEMPLTISADFGANL